jgi:hypothetical protein
LIADVNASRTSDQALNLVSGFATKRAAIERFGRFVGDCSFWWWTGVRGWIRAKDGVSGLDSFSIVVNTFTTYEEVSRTSGQALGLLVRFATKRAVMGCLGRCVGNCSFRRWTGGRSWVGSQGNMFGFDSFSVEVSALTTDANASGTSNQALNLILRFVAKGAAMERFGGCSFWC